MKTRAEIQLEYENQRVAIRNQYYAQIEAARATREAALAELDDPMARLIAAVKEHLNCRECWPLCISCQKALRDAIDYAEQRRAQG